MTETEFNRHPALHPTLKAFCCPLTTQLADVDFNLARVAADPIAHIVKRMFRATDNPFQKQTAAVAYAIAMHAVIIKISS